MSDTPSPSSSTVAITPQEFNQIQQQILQFKQLYYDEKQKLEKEKDKNIKINEKLIKYQKHYKNLKDQNAKFKTLLNANAQQSASQESQEKKEGKRKFFGFGGSKSAAPDAENELNQLKEEFAQFKEAKKRELSFFLAEKNQIQDQLQLLRDHFDGVRIEMAHHLHLHDIKELRAQIKRVLQIQDGVAEGEADEKSEESDTPHDEEAADRGEASAAEEISETTEQLQQKEAVHTEDKSNPQDTQEENNNDEQQQAPQETLTLQDQQKTPHFDQDENAQSTTSSPKKNTSPAQPINDTPPALSAIQNKKTSLSLAPVTVGSPKVQAIPTTEHLTALHAQISTYKQQADLFMEKNKLKQNRILELEEEQQELQNQVEEYKDALSQIKGQVKQKDSDLDHLLDDHKRLIEESNNKDSELNTAQQMISSYTKRLKDSQDSREKIAQEAHSLRSEVQQLKKTIASMEENTQQLSKTINELKNKVLHQEDDIKDLTSNNATKDKQIQEEKRQKEMLLFRCKEFKQMMNSREKSLQAEIDIMKEDSKVYDRQAKEYIHVWVKMVTDSVSEEHARSDLHSFQDEMSHLKERNTTFSSENQHLKTHNKALETRVSDTKVYYHLQVKQQKQLIKELKTQLKKERKRQLQQQQNWETSSTTSVETTETSVSSRNMVNSPSFSSGLDAQLTSPTAGSMDYQQLLSARDILTRENNVLLQRVGHLQATNWQHEETIKAMGRTIEHNKGELEKKSLIIQDYIKREKLGRIHPKQEQNKALMGKKTQSFMGSLWNRTAIPSSPGLLEVQSQMQSVLEETLMKNIQLGDDMQVLANEVDKLTQENRQLKDIIKNQLRPNQSGTTIESIENES
uniref:Uncharacterized protein n=1 Tax=Percolomonas cosmopolitus TaxID=63605 RepID=A0A7S1KQW9_9EUKA|eukprot:CAMPEP_0117441430 /NCGR_PEP_ID=MMETSP0759-20121206/3631_1 /TAXON_ID=63605 /ORGANISM="Percolomonas cosmopolitus, Strain WS" /LENGTH=855 /DNA_ID=CAMNT_0005233285 /DNA_START=8 /DNA_END=2575 /DNA_ORIENTATION=-